LDIIAIIINMNIEKWLDKFKNGWTGKNIPAIMKLFSDDIEYWETPYKKLVSVKDIKSEWVGIKNQEDIKVNMTVFSKSEQQNTYTVLWNLNYVLNGLTKKWSGIYLIKINSQGKCSYFYQVGEQIQ